MSPCTVLGATGYIGRHLVAQLRAQGHAVWAPLRGDAHVFSRELGHVFYCAGLTGNFRARPFDTLQAHVGFLAEVLRCARFDSLLYLSSTRVYLGADCTDEEAPLTVLPHDPSYLYNLSKLAGEALCHSAGPATVRVARLSNVVGPEMDWRSGNLVADLVHQARQGHMVLRSALASAKDYVHIDDVVDWLPRIALHGRSRTYNVASGRQTTHAQWLAHLGATFGCTAECAPEAALQSFPAIKVGRIVAEFGVVARPVLDGSLFARKENPHG